MHKDSIFYSSKFLKKLSIIGFSVMLIGCGADERAVNQKSKQKSTESTNETVGSTDENENSNQESDQGSSQENATQDNATQYSFSTIKDDSTLYIDFDIGSEGASVHEYEPYDMKVQSKGFISLSENVKLYRTLEIKYPVTVDKLFEIRNKDSTLNSKEFIDFSEETPIEEITNLDELNQMLGQNKRSWVVYFMKKHKLLTRLVVYVIKTDNENYFAIQPTAFEARAQPPTPFTLKIRVKKINNPLNIAP